MNYFLAQLIVAARDNDVGRWTNILFVVVVGIFWLIGGILKARANKAALKGEKQRPREPARKPRPSLMGEGKPPEEGVKVLEKQPIKQARRPAGPAQRRKVVRPRPAGRKVAAEIEKAIELPTLEPLEVSKVVPQIPKLAPELGELPEFTTKAVEKLPERRVVEEIPQAKYLVGVLLDYDDPEMLRKAILHYEILGKPLSVRGPGEHIIGL